MAADPVVVVVGLGPAGAGTVTVAARQALLDRPPGTPVFFRTSRHPAAEALIAELGGAARTFDDVYERSGTFLDVYASIVSDLLAAASRSGRVVYAVPGSPLVAESTFEMLREQAATDGVAVEVVAGMSFCDLAWVRLGVDPVASGVRVVDGLSFSAAAAGDHGPLLVAQTWSRAVLSEIKLSVQSPPPGMTAVLLHHLGLPDEIVAELPWPDIDRTIDPDHLTSLYIPSLGSPVAGEVMAVVETIATLRRECPWDQEQTHKTLLRHMLEETYEAIEALEGLGDAPDQASEEHARHAAEELGDVLCQVVFHAIIAREEGLFELADVARSLNDKLVRRHPHVFSDVSAETAAEVVHNWEQIKRAEKARQHVLDGIPAAMPALARAAAVERKLKSVGLGVALTGSGSTSFGPTRDPGQALLDVARRLAAEGIDPEAELRGSLDSLIERVARLETEAAAVGVEVSELSPERRASALAGGPVHA
ncbi:MAG: MazG nucleotide pyrophosphohydrolase domain-containing protein [Acidimicrobiales bacterium]